MLLLVPAVATVLAVALLLDGTRAATVKAVVVLALMLMLLFTLAAAPEEFR